MRRNFLKYLSLTIFSSFILPLNSLFANTKKIINKNLTKKQKEIMFNEGTERPFSSDLLRESRKGFYHCANCGNKLFASTSKFDSGTGWPSFSEALPGAFKTKIDYKFGMKRTEYHCAKCGAHHGHVFNDGPTKSGKSQLAEYFLKDQVSITYIATSRPRLNDPEWQKRISLHRKRRPNSWNLIENIFGLKTILDCLLI